MIDRTLLVNDWLPRYTGMPLEDFGRRILLTNFHSYLVKFSQRFGVPISGNGKPMQAATAKNGLTMINIGIGSPNMATIMDLLSAVQPEGVLFLGKCGGLKKSTEIGHFILPIAAIRGEGTSDDYFPSMVPALPSFKLHKFVSEIIIEHELEYRTGVIYTTNRRVWEHDAEFMGKLNAMTCLGIDMETATFFIVGHYNKIARGALLLVSDVPLTPEGVKTSQSDESTSRKWVDIHIDVGIEAMERIGRQGEPIKHFYY
jgi:AMP nucleosidase